MMSWLPRETGDERIAYLIARKVTAQKYFLFNREWYSVNITLFLIGGGGGGELQNIFNEITLYTELKQYSHKQRFYGQRE